MPDNARQALLQVSRAALFRYQIVGDVKARLLRGESLARAVRAVAGMHISPSGQQREAKPRSIYRWLKAFEKHGLAGLNDAKPKQPNAASLVLPGPLCDFLVSEKRQDRYASVPELIRRARQRGIIGKDDPIDRTSVWRACVRLGLPLGRLPGKQEADMRPFAYPHRMMMVIADGKYFRAGPQRLRRVAIFLLDDATRYGLGVVVGTSENTELFLRGIEKVICRHGLFDAVFLDGGPGFISDDTRTALALLSTLLIIGSPAYPEGHGKIERFNQTAQSQVLRGLPGAADVDPDPAALELRLEHYLNEQYNLTPHEALNLVSPRDRWEMDTKPLRFPESENALRERLVTTESRKVSAVNVISYDGIDYEVPRGHAGATIMVTRRLIGGELSVIHDGRRIPLRPVDLAHNALDRRARLSRPDDDEGTPTTAATLAFAKEFAPVVRPDGGCPDTLDPEGDLS